LEGRNEVAVHEILGQKLNVGRLEEILDGTDQIMQEQIHSGMEGFVQHLLPSIHARIEWLGIDMPSSQREQLWEQRISRTEAKLYAQGQVKHKVFPQCHIVLFLSRNLVVKGPMRRCSTPPSQHKGG